MTGIGNSGLGLHSLGAAAIVVMLAQTTSFAQTFSDNFIRLDPTATDPSGNSVATTCGGETYPDANASLEVLEIDGSSQVTITLTDARPNTIYTVWLRLKGNDPQGNAFGGSPLTNGGSTPLAPTSELGALLEATGDGNGTADVANGFFTDENGNGTLQVQLDCPMFNGAYPFQKFTDFDPEHPNYPIVDPRIYPVAIVIPDATIAAPFGLRIASHCIDEVGHGLLPGDREPWFDWEGPCAGDTNDDGQVDVTDLVAVISDWGTDGSTNGGDANESGLVDVNDLVTVITNWGSCD